MTLHPDELTDGYRRRIRKSGKCPDKSKVIEKISQQQEKRGAKSKSRAKACFYTSYSLYIEQITSNSDSLSWTVYKNVDS